MQRNLYHAVPMALWTLVVAGSLAWNIHVIRGNTQRIARNTGYSFFSEIEITRLWNARHGGVYVPVTETTQPNPYLDVPNRDVTTTGGVALTLVNPAFMTRQIAEIAQVESDIRYHITSLNPIRPANRADAWESVSLRAFEQGAAERTEFIEADGIFRYMAPLWVKPACLKCHAKQGYQVGQIRGGISVTLPSQTFLAPAAKSRNNAILIHCLFLVAGYAGYLFFSRFRDRHLRILDRKNRELENEIQERIRAETSLIEARKAADVANEAKSTFLANMSHEIRTPMNAIVGMCHLALRTELTPQQRDYLRKVETASRSLLGIINDILDFSKIEAGKLRMECIDFKLEEVFENLGGLMRDKAEEKGLELLLRISPDVPRILKGDPLRLGQVLLNLTSNAVKFTQKGEVVVSAEQIRTTDERASLRFVVRDTGIGLAPDVIKDLFQSFFQADTSITRRYGGTGLGLAISRSLVEMMGGEIVAESQPGQGSTFAFTAEFKLPGDTREYFQSQVFLKGTRVLVVDDNATSREILAEMLMSFSFEVVTADSGPKAIEALEAAAADRPFELVIMDWKMPGMDGIEAAIRIKDNRDLQQIPVVLMVTAHGREQVMQHAAKADLDAFLIKPINASVLFDTVANLFGEPLVKPSPVQEKDVIDSEPVKRIKGARILLVEDNAINQQVAGELLRAAGMHVEIAGNGMEALIAVKTREFDLVLMDIHMADMDGYAVVREIRKWEKSRNREIGIRNQELGEGQGQELGIRNQELGKDGNALIPNSQFPTPIPIIAMTAHAMSGDREKSLKAGMNDHVTKPIDPDKLFTALVKWIAPENLKGLKLGLMESPAESAEARRLRAIVARLDTLPGIDVAAGLHKIADNIVLFFKLWQDFSTDHANTAKNILDAVTAGNMSEALRLTHTLKGMAGNLGAEVLYHAGQKLEECLKKEETPLPAEVWESFETALNHVLSSARELTAAQAHDIPEREAPEDQGEGGTGDSALLLAKLEGLLTDGDAGALELIKTLKANYAGKFSLEWIEGLDKHVQNFDFPEALKLLKQVVRSR